MTFYDIREWIQIFTTRFFSHLFQSLSPIKLPMILIVDNYDSFTYNLVQRLGEIDPGLDIRVFRNDEISPAEMAELGPTHVIISPGPCTPTDAGISMECAERFHGTVPLLGVCLGHQSIGQVMGATIVRAEQLMHGKTDQIQHTGTGVFAGLPNPMTATRYHSLVIQPDTLPADFNVTAWVDDAQGRQIIMGIEHQTHPTFGVQFHPESFLTDGGIEMLKNFLATRRI
jgi:anthranilate synthase/aminodeoxychorismate synthase-like glutamine amidotransferase